MSIVANANRRSRSLLLLRSQRRLPIIFLSVRYSDAFLLLCITSSLQKEGLYRTSGHRYVVSRTDNKKMEKQLKAAAQYLSPEQAAFSASNSMIL